MSRMLQGLLALALAWSGAMSAQAAGVLITTDKPGNPQPFRWNTAKPIPVYTDLGVFAFQNDGVTPFISNQRANELVAFALKQWSDVPTSTFKAYRAGDFTQVPSIGVDINASNVDKVYGVDNGGGMHVIYDTDGMILENYFGVPRDAVLGIAFPEIAIDADGDGYEETIVEATALMNGYAVWFDDTDGSKFAGIMTHEFGHALNLSHAQVNGAMAYQSFPGYFEAYPGVPGCVRPYHRAGMGGNDMPSRLVETMYPFIDNSQPIGYEMSTVDRPDDIAAISNLYPTSAYAATTGSISGVLRLKDGKTPYSGINVVARNVNDPLGDAVSAMTGDNTQGKAGPDGRFTIRNLKPGQRYWLYIEEIVAGGYPTQPRALVSEAEYWNAGENANPATDKACDATPITAVAGATQTADITFNGYANGVQYFPVTDGALVKLSRDGSKASGVYYATQFTWDQKTGVEVLPPEVLATSGAMSANGKEILVNTDLDGNGINGAAIWRQGRLKPLGSLNKDRCGGDGFIGRSSAFGMALDDRAETAVGVAYVDADRDGECQGAFLPEILPFIWTERGGMRTLDYSGHDFAVEGWMRAQGISGDGSVVLGETNYSKTVAWVNEGKRIDLFKLHGAMNAYAANADGTRIMLDTVKVVNRKAEDGNTYEYWLPNGQVMWNAKQGPRAVVPVGGLSWCTDIKLPATMDWSTGQVVDQCATLGTKGVKDLIGMVPIQINDSSNDGKVVVGRAGTPWIEGSTEGVMWVEGLGWLKLADFFRRQGVAEAYRFGLQNPVSLNAAGNELVGGLVGAFQTWYVDMKDVYVCENRRSQRTRFPAETVERVRGGAKLGRCEHI